MDEERNADPNGTFGLVEPALEMTGGIGKRLRRCSRRRPRFGVDGHAQGDALDREYAWFSGQVFIHRPIGAARRLGGGVCDLSGFARSNATGLKARS
jgi:hypothetical protein